MNRMAINEIELNNLIQKMIMFIDKEEEELKKIERGFLSLSTVYNSNNTNHLEKDNADFFANFNKLVENRKQYVRTIKKSIENYQVAADYTTRVFQNHNK